MTVLDAAPPGKFVHPALFYGSDEQYLAGLIPFITDGLTSNEPVAVAVPGDRLPILRGALGAGADGVHFINMNEAGRNPGRIIPAVLRAFADNHPDVHVRIIGEPIWPGRSATEYPACAQHEALINAAFAGRDVSIVCPYDTTGLDPSAVADARATHPLVWEGTERFTSSDYDPTAVLDRFNQPLPEPEAAAEFLVCTSAEIADARHWSAERARGFGLSDDRLADLELIVTELVTNGLCHGRAPSRLRIWQDADYLICEVNDKGQLLDPLAGRRPRAPGQFGGLGLLMVHQLSDLVRTHTNAHGTTQYALLARKTE